MTSDEMYDVIMDIRGIRGNRAKQAFLRRYPDMQSVLRTTYNPYIAFDLRPTNSWQTGWGDDVFDSQINSLLHRLATGTISGNLAKSSVKTALNRLTYKSGQVLLMILNRSFDFGLGRKLINEIFPGLIPTHAIQLAKVIDWDKVTYPVMVSPKIDGLRAIYKNGKFFSRAGHVFKGLTKLEDYLQSHLSQDAILDGELTVEGEHFNEINGAIRSFNETDNAQYNIFDIPELNGHRLTERWQQLSNIYNNLFKPEENNVFLVEHKICFTRDEAEELHGVYVEQGYEGAMVKNPGAQYIDGRSVAWMKIKGINDVDVEVTGVFEGHGKYKDMAGGLIVNFNSKAVRVGSGLTDRQRVYFWDDPDEVIGRTATVIYQEVTPDGSLRHPRLKTLRGDK